MGKLILWLLGFGVVMSLLVQGATSAMTAAIGPGPTKGILESAEDSASRTDSTMRHASGRPSANDSAASYGETVIGRDYAGHFNVTATVNGHQVPFLVDTGADTVSLTVETARSIGLYVDESAFQPVAMGAGGPVRGQHITIDRIEIGTRSLTGVDAMVLEGLGTNLLGQSALSQLGGVELRGDQMVLR